MNVFSYRAKQEIKRLIGLELMGVEYNEHGLRMIFGRNVLGELVPAAHFDFSLSLPEVVHYDQDVSSA